LSRVIRHGELFGLSAIIADLIEGNLQSEPERARFLKGPQRSVQITAEDLDSDVSLVLGIERVEVADGKTEKPHVWIRTDSLTLLDLPNAKLFGGLPSITDATGRDVIRKMLSGRLKIKGMMRIGLVRRVQMLLSVA
jgi:hypothetical protein